MANTRVFTEPTSTANHDMALQLEADTNYVFTVTDADGAANDQPEITGYFTTERVVPASRAGHVVDGKFTGWDAASSGNASHEWSDVTPVRGRYGFLYVDFDGSYLHILNDWFCTNDIPDGQFNKFGLSLTPKGGQTQEWLLKVYPDGRLDVELDGQPYAGDCESAYSYESSPKLPSQKHTIYELRIPISATEAERSSDDWDWNLEWLDPIVISQSSGRSSVMQGPTPVFKQVQEPLRLRGVLRSGGGLTVLADFQPVDDKECLKVVSGRDSVMMSWKTRNPYRAQVNVQSLNDPDFGQTWSGAYQRGGREHPFTMVLTKRGEGSFDGTVSEPGGVRGGMMTATVKGEVNMRTGEVWWVKQYDNPTMSPVKYRGHLNDSIGVAVGEWMIGETIGDTFWMKKSDPANRADVPQQIK